MPLPKGLFVIAKEVLRHILRRPVVGVALAARVPDGRWVLIRRSDTGEWALPGGTLEWGETLRDAAVRELLEEAGCDVRRLGELAGVYSRPERDARFHAVTVVVYAEVSEPARSPINPSEILEVGLFEEDKLPERLSHGMTELLMNARTGRLTWE